MNNPLDRMPRVREVLLFIQWLVTGAQTILGALFGFMYGTELDRWPTWFLASLAVAPVAWSYLGFTAQRNVTGTDHAGLPINTTTSQETA